MRSDGQGPALNALRGGKRICSLAHYVDIQGISEKPISPFPRDLFDDAQPYEMIQRVCDRWNSQLEGFRRRSNADERVLLHEFLDAQRGRSAPPHLLYIFPIFGEETQRSLRGVCFLLG